MASSLKIGHVILIFALAALPFAATFVLYYPDERHYTDGALMMLNHRDWLVPHTAAGATRFEKPILAYWAVAASWLVFGVNTLAARLPFLLASCGTLWLTHRLAKKLTGDDRAALLAAIVLASQPQFILCSVRSIPDALLVFFITLSAFGFLRLIVFEEFMAGAFGMAYGGAAGAALSKGLLGAGIVLFAWAFVFARDRNWRAAIKLIHWPSLAAAFFLVAGWFGYIFATHGLAALANCFGDQVTGNMRGHFWSPLARVPLFSVVLLVNFLPWSVTAIEFVARRKSALVEHLPALAQKFILAWSVLLVLGFALGANVSLRYLLPAAPLLAILVAVWLRAAETEKLFFPVDLVFAFVLTGLFLLMLSALATGYACRLAGPIFALVGAGFAAGFVLMAVAALRRKDLPAPESLGLAMLLGWLFFFAAAMPVFLPDRSQQIAATLRESKNSAAPVLLVGDVRLASRLRVQLGKDWTIVQTDRLILPETTNYSRILISEPDRDSLAQAGWTIQPAAIGRAAPAGSEIWPALKSRQLPEALARRGPRIFLATHE